MDAKLFVLQIMDLLLIQHRGAMEMEQIKNDALFDELCNLLQMCICASKFSRYKVDLRNQWITFLCIIIW